VGSLKNFIIASIALVICMLILAGSINLISAAEEKGESRIRIVVKEVPPSGAGPDTWGEIKGNVFGANPAKHRIIVYAGTDIWYVQPYENNYYTRINSDGTWKTGIHLGNRYAVLVVDKDYKAKTRTGELPEVGGKVLAILTMDAK